MLCGAQYYTRRCAVITKFWDADRNLIPHRNLALGAQYYVYLDFKTEGVSDRPTGDVCHRWCPGEVLYKITYNDNRRLCAFSSESGAVADRTLSYCLKCTHFCHHVPSPSKNLNSLDACRIGSYHPLYWLWNSVLNQKKTMEKTLAWLHTLGNDTQGNCLKAISGLSVGQPPAPHCLSSVGPLKYGKITVAPTRRVLCRVKMWNPVLDPTLYGGCDAIFLDYYRYYQKDVITYVEKSEDFATLLSRLYPNVDIFMSLGGAYFAGDAVSDGTSDYQKAILVINAAATLKMDISVDATRGVGLGLYRNIMDQVISSNRNPDLRTIRSYAVLTYTINGSPTADMPSGDVPVIFRNLNGTDYAAMERFLYLTGDVQCRERYVEMPVQYFINSL